MFNNSDVHDAPELISPPEEKKKPELARIRQQHLRILDMVIEGYPNSEIATITGMAPGSISRIVSSPLFQNELAIRRKSLEGITRDSLANSSSKAREKLEAEALNAANTLVDLARNSQNDAVRRASANDILDRVFGKDDNSTRPAVNISIKELTLLKQIMAEDDDNDVDIKPVNAIITPA
jgi:hypothetical protein